MIAQRELIEGGLRKKIDQKNFVSKMTWFFLLKGVIMAWVLKG